MLEELELHDLGPIRAARLVPAAGMTAITGETGAGKSMLLSALKLISGAGADAGRVRPGSACAWAQGVFAVAGDHAAVALAEDAGSPVEDGELFLSRRVPAARAGSKSGRSRAVLGGKTVPRSVLEHVARELVTIHGQADQLRIASPVRQREFLDDYAGNGDLKRQYAADWSAYMAVEDKLTRLTTQQAQMRQQADYLRDSIAQIDRVDPHDGELEELKERRDRIENAAQVSEAVVHALALLDSSSVPSMDNGSDAPDATGCVAGAIGALEAAHVPGVFDGALAALADVQSALSEVSFALSGKIDDELGAGDLDMLNGRIHELNELCLRWGPELSDVIRWRDQAAFDVEDLDASPEKLADLEEQRDRRYAAALKTAKRLSRSRAKAAAALSATVTGELGELAMPGASLDIAVSERRGSAPLDGTGADDVEFLFTPFPSSPKLPMGKSASGGELSRLMLALELASAETAVGRAGHAASSGDAARPVPPMTFIFDEIDAGVGGKAAVELGRRLARLARSAQVIVVTHLAQVASWADAQYVVTKTTASGDDSHAAGRRSDDSVTLPATETTVQAVDGDDRVREIARMLSGTESSTSRKHARELLASSTLEHAA
ncbi:DNA repair protein RecN [Bifidobacterium choloepi]|uniref:DNA repair protein RecN n=1 Tax=Bifidobacterium choloepi TaxID=2614131 RepID=A0A6I5NNF7_9BIFI|nr:DNA repair protein RecN [Bifidobacterium choloepi]NEG70252.1 DNA repair protein RecN [Bifidobacterium choloepi]